jgi:hypothetical protein
VREAQRLHVARVTFALRILLAAFGLCCAKLSPAIPGLRFRNAFFMERRFAVILN